MEGATPLSPPAGAAFQEVNRFMLWDTMNLLFSGVAPSSRDPCGKAGGAGWARKEYKLLRCSLMALHVL